MHTFDITILTDQRYLLTDYPDVYSQHVVLEDRLLKEALERKGLVVHRTNWDDPNFDWESTEYIFFRSTWDYFERYEEFAKWLDTVSTKTKLINPKASIDWSLDKHYLLDLLSAGVRIPPTSFIEMGDQRSLESIISKLDWSEFILKPTISGCARHTYRFKKDELGVVAPILEELIQSESMMLQEFQTNILTKGEVAYMVFGGKFSHAVLKRAKAGDFRVQDDFGGTIHAYSPSEDEIAFVESAFAACKPIPVYARVDVLWDNNDALCIGEIELIEPELWFRMDPTAADKCAEATLEFLKRS